MEDSVQVSAIPPHTSVSKSPAPCCLLARDIPSHSPLREGLFYLLLSEQMWHTWVPVHAWSLKVLQQWKLTEHEQQVPQGVMNRAECL